MDEQYKEGSRRFWDEHATLWESMAYDKDQKFLCFPTSRQRAEITVSEISRNAADRSADILDIGCATGELVRRLLRNDFSNARGMDLSEMMLEVARERLLAEFHGADAERTFFHSDADLMELATGQYDFVSALGIIEYLQDGQDFVGKVERILKPGGMAYIESRNKLFNLYSANTYTAKSDISKLLQEMEEIRHLSPITDEKEVESIVIDCYIRIGEEMERLKSQPVESDHEEGPDRFPYPLPQYTPGELGALAERQGLTLKHVIFYHAHPFVPKYQKQFPTVFNRAALQMQRLGYTPLGSSLCSSYVAVMTKGA